MGTEEKVSKNTHTLQVSGSGSLFMSSLIVCLCVGAGYPGDGGSIAMVTESASAKIKGKKDREDTTVADSELN